MCARRCSPLRQRQSLEKLVFSSVTCIISDDMVSGTRCITFWIRFWRRRRAQDLDRSYSIHLQSLLISLSKMTTHSFGIATQELYANFTSLIMDPFASHVIRALLLLLSPTSRQAEGSNNSKSRSGLRSKKSVAWKARQAPMKNVFSDLKGKTAEDNIIRTPEVFREAAGKFVRIVRDELDANEVRALAADKVASPVLQVRTSSQFITLFRVFIILNYGP